MAVGASAGSGGSGGSITDFPDNQFTIFAVGDVTKILDFDLSGLTTAFTRTITPADANMTMLSTVDYTDLTDGGETTLHAHAYVDYYREPVTNGDPISPEIVFDADGDVVMIEGFVNRVTS